MHREMLYARILIGLSAENKLQGKKGVAGAQWEEMMVTLVAVAGEGQVVTVFYRENQPALKGDSG